MSPDIWVSIIALIVSLVVARYSYKQGRKSNALQEEQTKLQRRVVELEEEREDDRQKDLKQAKFTTEFIETGQHSHRLIIKNIGKSTARKIKIYFNGEPISQTQLTNTKDIPDLIEIIELGADISLPIIVTKETAGRWEISIQWSDDYENNREFTTHINI